MAFDLTVLVASSRGATKANIEKIRAAFGNVAADLELRVVFTKKISPIDELYKLPVARSAFIVDVSSRSVDIAMRRACVHCDIYFAHLDLAELYASAAGWPTVQHLQLFALAYLTHRITSHLAVFALPPPNEWAFPPLKAGEGVLVGSITPTDQDHKSLKNTDTQPTRAVAQDLIRRGPTQKFLRVARGVVPQIRASPFGEAAKVSSTTVQPPRHTDNPGRPISRLNLADATRGVAAFSSTDSNGTYGGGGGGTVVELSAHYKDWAQNILCTNLDRVVTSENRATPYVPSDASNPRVAKSLHFGQRKLFLSEVEFLTQWIRDHPAAIHNTLCVYAGAADGRHLPFLFELFPTVKWYLADPNRFTPEVTIARYPQIVKILNDLFLDSTCDEIAWDYPDAHILLISDIRAGDPLTMSPEENTRQINEDNSMQARWVRLLNARRSMLKFHPPYPDMTPFPEAAYIEYYKGQVYLGVWAPKSSTEVRLVVPAQAPFIQTGERKTTKADLLGGRFAPHEGAWALHDAMWAGRPTTAYNCKSFEERLYDFNTRNRFAADVAAEARILAEYIMLVDAVPILGKSSSLNVVALSSMLSRRLSASGFAPIRAYRNVESAMAIEMESRVWFFANALQSAPPPFRVHISPATLAAVAKEIAEVYPTPSALFATRADTMLPIERMSRDAAAVIEATRATHVNVIRAIVREAFGNFTYAAGGRIAPNSTAAYNSLKRADGGSFTKRR